MCILPHHLQHNKPLKSEGSTPNSTPQKWDRERVRGREGGGGRTREGAGGRMREGVGGRAGGRPDQVVSSDDEAPITSVARPRQRALKRRRSCLTNHPSSNQLVRMIDQQLL